MKPLLYYKILFYFILISGISANEGPLPYPEPAGGWIGNDSFCNSTKIQSPIDIPSILDNVSLIVDDSSHAKIQSLSYTRINKGEVNFDGGHKWTTEGELDIGYLEIYLNGALFKYKVNGFHFHLYSEHRIENRQYPMEMHIVHKNTNAEDSENEYLVIGILFDYKDNVENKFLNDIKLAENKTINNASFLELISQNDPFYYYKGSLTTVPCNESVNWIVFRDIRTMSFQQFKKFRIWIESTNPEYYGTGYGNARGPKQLNGRKIYLENINGESESNMTLYFKKSSSGKLSGGAIAGIVVGCVAALALATVIAILAKKGVFSGTPSPAVKPPEFNSTSNALAMSKNNANVV